MRRRTSKITNPMTPIGPAPFVGRQDELAELKQHLALTPLVSLHGSLGSGKTRLVGELAPQLGAPCTVIECHPGDRASALRARAERALRCPPGSLAQTLDKHARVLVLDDIQHLLLTRTPAITGRYEFLSFDTPAGGRAWLTELLDKVQTEDEAEKCKEEIQALTKRFEAKVNEMAEKKSAEVLEI